MEILQLITEFEKHIYNTYLKTLRTSRKLPFKLRQDFSELDAQLYNTLKKLSHFFKKHAHIKVEDFFKAPFSLYKDETFFSLEFFYTLKAIKAYTLLNKKQTMQDPDNIEQLEFIKKSLIFIYNFCKTNHISLDQYIFHKTNNEYSFMLHLQQHNVSVYALLGFDNFESLLKKQNCEIAKFVIGEDLYNNIPVFRTKLYNSNKAFNLVKLGIKKLEMKA